MARVLNVRRLLGFVAGVLVNLLRLSLRNRYHHIDSGGCDARPASGQFILCVWHQQLLSALSGQTAVPLVAMASRSADADGIAKALEWMGHVPVRGSSSKRGRDKGGGQAMREMVEQIKRGMCGGITPDGPTGPARKVKRGIISIASECQVPILPAIALASRYWEFNSWDRFRLPKPFARVDLYYGKPIPVPENLDAVEYAEWQARIETAMNELEQRAMRRAGLVEGSSSAV